MILPTINGIQQVGIGVSDANLAWNWYRKAFKMDVPIFQDSAEAKLMTKYTAGKVESRHAILALNMQGGGGFEIWQYTSKIPLQAPRSIQLNDLGIIAVKMRCRDIRATYAHFESLGADIQGKPSQNPIGIWHFYVKDPFGNLFELEENSSWFSKNKDLTGGVSGVVIGVSSIEKVLPIYQKALLHADILVDKVSQWEDFGCLPNGNESCRRMILQSSPVPTGAFGKLFCQNTLELIENQEQIGMKIFENRNWGDLGFIHLCFDVSYMDSLKAQLEQAGYPLTVDSQSEFDMGAAAGRFAYIEDPDGTLVEFVETFKIPILEKWGLFLNLKNRKNKGPLSNFFVKLLGLNRVKN
jgi:catechol 2,3-dioxygenase-like lactoylglutathione lyase family enzyme